MAVDDDERVTLTYEDMRGNVLIAELHEDRLTMMVSSQSAENDWSYTHWVDMTPEQARQLAQLVFRRWGET